MPQARVLALAVLVVLVLAAVPTANAQGTWSTVVSPTSSGLSSIYMVSADEGWAVGSSGTIVHYANRIWNLVTPSLTTENLYSVFMVSADEGWAVGDGAILHYSLGAWSVEAHPAGGGSLLAVSMVSPSEGWAVGGGGMIIHYTGGVWSQYTPYGGIYPTTNSLRAVYMQSANFGWAVGDGGTIIRYDPSSGAGTPWGGVPMPSGTLNNLRSIFWDGTTGWIVGDGGTILHHANGLWSPVSSPTTQDLYSVSMVSAGEGFAVGPGVILHCVAGSWTDVTPSLANMYLFSVDMVSASEGWAVGQGGTILVYTGPGAPSVKTLAATDVTATSALLHAGVNPKWFATTWQFTDPSGTVIYCPPSPDTSLPVDGVSHSVSCTVNILSPSTHYDYVIRASNSAGSIIGNTEGFTTTAAPVGGGAPVVVTGSASDITATSAVLHATVNPNGLATQYAFWNYPSRLAVYCPSGTLPADSLVHDVSCTVSTLAPSTHYDYMIYAKNDAGGSEGLSVGFDTPASGAGTPAFTVSCDPSFVTVVQGGSGSSTCTVTSLNGFDADVTLSSSWTGTGPTGFSSTLSPGVVHPSPGTPATTTIAMSATAVASLGSFTYHVKGTSGIFEIAASVVVQITAPGGAGGAAPTVVTGAASDVTATSVVLHGTVNPNGLSTTWDFTPTTGSPYCSVGSLPADSVVHDVSCTVNTLTASTGYDFMVRATNSAGTSLGSDVTFTTLAAGAGVADFSISCTPATVVQGGSGSSTCTVTSLNGFDADVTLSSSWTGTGPTGFSSMLSPGVVHPSPGTPATTTIAMSATAVASLGSFTYHVKGTSGTLVHSTDVPVYVTLAAGAGAAGFSIAANPASLSLGAGASGASTITIQSLGSFSSPVSLSATGPGFNFAWGQNPVPAPVPGGQSQTTLTVTVAGAAVGPQTVTITGTSTTDPTMTSHITLTVTVAGGGGGGCLIATATYGSELSPEVQFLRNFRDNSILRTTTGSSFMIAFNAWYYSFSPFVAEFIRENSLARTVTKLMLYPLMGILKVGASAFYIFPGNLEVGAVVSGVLVSSLIGMVYMSPPLAAVLGCSRRIRRIAKRLELPTVAVMLSALVIAAFIAVVGAPLVFMMLSTATIVLATLASSALYTSRALLHILKRAHVS